VHDADDRGLGDGRMRHRGVLEVDGADPFAARLDDVLRAVGDLHEAVLVERRDVARGEPAVGERIAALARKYSRVIQGPRTRRSPKALPSRGSSLPSSSTIFISTPKMARPCLFCSAWRSASDHSR
jgi:hypothetical protein